MLEIRPANTLTVPSFASRNVNLDVDLGALAIRYVFSTTITDSDPGNGKLRLSATQQDAALTIRADTLDVNGVDVSGILDAFDDSTSATKGSLRIYKVSDPTKWLVFDVTALAAPTGYRNITVENVAGSDTSPFADGDTVLLSFQPAGEKGQMGPSAASPADRTELAALDTSTINSAFLLEAGREGQFAWRTGDYSAQVAADTRQGIYVAPTSDATGASGAWVRVLDGHLNVSWFGVGATDDYAAFQAAIDLLPAEGGRIVVPNAAYVIETSPDWGTKSLLWDIDPSAVFSGAGTGQGKFPYANTNSAQLAVGPFYQSKSQQHSTNSNGGIATMTVEMLQPSDYGAGQSVAVFAGARGSNPNPAGNVWAGNFLVAATGDAAGVYNGIEVDVDTSAAAAVMKGVAISGGGTVNADVALEITRASEKWDRGIHVLSSSDAIVIDPVVSGRGLVIKSTSGDVAPSVGAAISARKNASAGDTILLQRDTDASPSGNLIRAVNAANGTNLFILDVLGNLRSEGVVNVSSLRIRGSAEVVGAGEVAFGAATQAGGTVPATAAGYIIINVGGTGRLLPYYAA